jgi:hypothetical protein
MSAAARPKRWGVFPQAKGREFDSSGVELSTYLTGRATKGTWGNLGRQKEKEMKIHKWISSDGSELVPTTDVKVNLTLPYLEPKSQTSISIQVRAPLWTSSLYYLKYYFQTSRNKTLKIFLKKSSSGKIMTLVLFRAPSWTSSFFSKILQTTIGNAVIKTPNNISTSKSSSKFFVPCKLQYRQKYLYVACIYCAGLMILINH